MFDAADAVATPVILEGLVIFSAVFQRFTEGKSHVRLIVGIATFGGDLFSHVLDIVIAETKGLQISQAPVGLANLRTQADTFPVGFNGFIQSSHCFQGVTVTHLGPGLVGIVPQHLLVNFKGLFVRPDTNKDSAFEGQKIGIIRFQREQFLSLTKRSFRFLQTH